MAFVARRRDRPSEVSIKDRTSISIDSATVNIEALRLLDVGELKRIYGSIYGGTSTLYTVPAGKVFYLFAYFFHFINEYATAARIGNIQLFDGATAYIIDEARIYTQYQTCHSAGQFTMMKLPAGWSVRLVAGTTSESRGGVLGVEMSA